MNAPHRAVTAKDVRGLVDALSKTAEKARLEGVRGEGILPFVLSVMLGEVADQFERYERAETAPSGGEKTTTSVAELTPWDLFVAAGVSAGMTNHEACVRADVLLEQRAERAKKGAL